jgi:G:T-mismatch repair DNA endonuclease (very short patch repair protein)
VERDKRNIAALENDGWEVMEVWECQTRKPEETRQLETMLKKFLL